MTASTKVAHNHGSSRGLKLAVLTFVFVAVSPFLSAAQQPTSTPADWRADLQTLSASLPALHKNLFFKLSRTEFDNAVARLYGEIPSLSDSQIIVRMAEIVAAAGDAHTSLSLSQNPVPFRYFPIRLQWFSDGIFVTAVSPEYRSALGCRLVKIGDADIQQVYEVVGKVISHENEPWQQYMSQTYLLIPELLHALGFLTDEEKGRFVFQTGNGDLLSLDLAPVARSQTIPWITPFDPGNVPLPLYMKNSASGYSYWSEFLSDSGTVYMKYDSCRSDAGLPFNSLIDAMSTLYSDYGNAGLVKRYVFDVRNNSGGSSAVIAPLLYGLQQAIYAGAIRSSDIYVIIGRQTFSSGMLNAMNRTWTPIIL